MRELLLIISFFQLFAIPICSNRVKNDIAHCWLNAKYMDCLKNSLPCECEKITETYFSLVIDTTTSSKNFGVALSKYDLLEPSRFSIKKIGHYEYGILSIKNDTQIWARILINLNAVYLIEKTSQSVFYESNNSVHFNIQHYLLDNVVLVNKSLNQRGYPKLEDIVKDDSLICECNKWKGKINLLSVVGKAQSWILEIKNDSLFIDRGTYSNEDPDPDDPILHEKYKAYRWQ
ncbi:MAG: hypothetical protein WBP41_18035 [Saprospiraceae bacterium]